MEDILALAQFGVEGGGRLIAFISLDVDYPRAALPSDRLELLNHAGGETTTPMLGINGKVVDVNLRSSLLKFVQDVSAERSKQGSSSERDDLNKIITCQQTGKIGVIGLCVQIGARIVKCLRIKAKDGSHSLQITGFEAPECVVAGHFAG